MPGNDKHLEEILDLMVVEMAPLFLQMGYEMIMQLPVRSRSLNLILAALIRSDLPWHRQKNPDDLG